MITPQQLVEKALELSRADGCQVIVSESSDANLRWAGNTLTTNGVSRSRDVTVISTVGNAVGVVSRSNPDADALAAMVGGADEAARQNGPAEDAGPLVTPEQAPAAAGWDDPAGETSIGVFAGLAGGLGAAFERARAADRLLFGFASHSVSTTYLGTSAGIRLRHVQPTGKVEINGKSADYARSAWTGVATRDFADVDVAALDAELTERLGWAARQVPMEAGTYETILPPSAIADLMIYAYWTAAGRDAAEGRTVFSAQGGGTRVGERLTDAKLTLRSDPAEPGLECCPFSVAAASSSMSSVFDNGLAMGATDWIRNGELANLVNTRFTADKTGGSVTPPIDNLILAADTPGPTLAEMIAGTERALLLTCLWYIREVDAQTLLLTGLTRDGVYLVENGEVTGAVNNFRFNVSPIDLLARMTEIGPTAPCLPREWSDYFTRTAMPPVRIDGFLMSSVSQAS